MPLDNNGLERVCDLANTDSLDVAWDIEREVTDSVSFSDIQQRAQDQLPFLREFYSYLVLPAMKDTTRTNILRLQVRARAARRAAEYEAKLLKRIGLEVLDD